jgi:starch synthase
MKRPKVLFLASEMTPFAKVGGLADVVGTLPAALQALGVDARVVMPLYAPIKRRFIDRMTLLDERTIRLGWRSQFSALYVMNHEGVPVYFVDNEFYFGHDRVYVEYGFDIERFAFFQRAVLDALGDPMSFLPDVLHCNDWQSAMVPFLLESHYRPSGYHVGLKTVFTIHNLMYQGLCAKETAADLFDIPAPYLREDGILSGTAANPMKAGIRYSDAVTTVSPTYAREILTLEFGEGLDGLLRARGNVLSGILNGIDEKDFDPSTDFFLDSHFGPADVFTGKPACRRALRKELGLRDDASIVAGMVTRLYEQKGIDLVLEILEAVVAEGIQLAILGTGDSRFENALREAAERHPGRMAFVSAFDEGLAHRIYAGADLFLMPSRFEPCGLSQMIAMRYGTLPVVRETGGLKDTVIPYNEHTGEGTGFSFRNAVSSELLAVLRNAVEVHRTRPAAFERLMMAAMAQDFSFRRSAERFESVYLSLMAESATDPSESWH